MESTMFGVNSLEPNPYRPDTTIAMRPDQLRLQMTMEMENDKQEAFEHGVIELQVIEN